MRHSTVTLTKNDLKVGAICALGRGIEKATTKFGDRWCPTRYIELPNAQGGHSGKRTAGIGINDEGSVIAGAHANVLAACQLYQELRDKDLTPQVVTFAAGRPRYLSDDPDPTLTEGKILSEYFLRKARPRPWETEVLVFSHNRDTQDDIEEFLSLAAARRIDRTAIITVEVHIPRALEFSRRVSLYSSAVQLTFIPAEEILARRYARRSSFMTTLRMCRDSAAHRRTLAREQRGIEALRSGQYKRSG
jgi:hypothetical protein